VDDLTSRAFRAYFRRNGSYAPQPSNHSGPVKAAGRTYVVLQNANGPLAVYGVGRSGRLVGLRDWPAEVIEGL